MNRIAISLVVAAMLLTLSISGCLEDDGSDYGVTWEEPASITIIRFYYDDVGEAFEVAIRLWDLDDEVTEWAGEVRIIIYDDNLEPTHNQARNVEPKDFTTERDPDITGTMIVDTFLEMQVKKTEMAADPSFHQYPSWTWDVEVWCSYNGLTIKSPHRNWRPPEVGYVQEAGVEWSGDELYMELVLERMKMMYPVRPFGDPYEEAVPTKAKGQLAVNIKDSLGFTMYQGRLEIEPQDFEIDGRITMLDSPNGITSCDATVLIPITDIKKSSDRWPGEMNLTAAFIYNGRPLDKDGHGSIIIDIPESLVLPNQPAIIRLSAPEWCWFGEDVTFDISGSYDPDGEIHDMGILVDANYTTYVQRQRPSATQPMGVIAFFELGTFDLTIKIQDSDLEWNETIHQIEVISSIKIEAVETGIANSTWGHHNNTYVTLRLTNQAWDTTSTFGQKPLLIVVDEHGTQFEINGTEGGGYPYSMAESEVKEITLYYEYIPDGETHPVPFVPVTMILWPGQELDLTGLWIGP